MEKFKAFCKRKNIEVSAKRYGIDALGAMAQGLFCSLLIGTIIKTLGAQLGVPFLTDIGTYAMSVSGPAMAVAIGYALKADPMVLFSLAAVGWAANAEGGAGGPLAVLIIAILAAECGKAVSKETKIDILVTPAVTILVGVALAKWIAPHSRLCLRSRHRQRDQTPAVLDGHCRLRARGRRAHAAHLLRRHLRGAEDDRSCRRRGRRRLLRADGRLRRDEL